MLEINCSTLQFWGYGAYISLCLLFNLSLRSGSLPDDWKISNIVPVFKKGKRDHVSNYRPISLLSNISKVLERCVLVKTRDHLLQYVSDNQHGFIPGRSCATQLVQVLECIGQQLDNGKQTDIIYLDMSKAFDRVRHDVLLDKLLNINIRGNLHSWFSSYLSGRKQRVTVPGGISSSLVLPEAYLKVLFLDLYYSFSKLMIYMIQSSLLPFPVLLMILNYLKLLTTERTRIYCKTI